MPTLEAHSKGCSTAPGRETSLHPQARYAHPAIAFNPAGEAEIRTIEIKRETDQFVILASDGLWDVMSSEEAVQYVHSIMARAIQAGSGDGSGESLRSALTEAAVLRIV